MNPDDIHCRFRANIKMRFNTASGEWWYRIKTHFEEDLFLNIWYQVYSYDVYLFKVNIETSIRNEQKSK